MIRQANIQSAIAAYGFWRAELRVAVTTGRANMTSAEAAEDRACEFGKWLESIPAADRSDPHFDKVQDLHTRFHAEAASVLRLVESGQTAKAGHELERGSGFEHVSRELTRTLIDWSKAA